MNWMKKLTLEWLWLWSINIHIYFFKVQASNAVKQDIKDSNKERWTWLRNQPKAIRSFCRDGGVFIAILQKAFKESECSLDELVIANYFNDNTILHCLSKDPLSKEQVSFVMDILCHKDINPGKKNKAQYLKQSYYAGSTRAINFHRCF